MFTSEEMSASIIEISVCDADVPPRESVTVSLIVYVPGCMNAWDTFFPAPAVLSPKSHCHETMFQSASVLEEPSNEIEAGAFASSAEGWNIETGCWLGTHSPLPHPSAQFSKSLFSSCCCWPHAPEKQQLAVHCLVSIAFFPSHDFCHSVQLADAGHCCKTSVSTAGFAVHAPLKQPSELHVLEFTMLFPSHACCQPEQLKVTGHCCIVSSLLCGFSKHWPSTQPLYTEDWLCLRVLLSQKSSGCQISLFPQS